jgi:glutamine amidotransferase
MCRFVAYLGEALSPAPLVFGGEHSLYRQSWSPRELLSGSINADGYGVVWYHEGRPRRIAETRPIWHDGELEDTLSGLTSTCILAALRNATPGQPVDRAGLLPLVHDRFSFILNGFIPDFHTGHMRELRAALPDDLYAALRGSSDAETLFLSAVALVREGAGLSGALEEVARRVQGQVGKVEAQMNMVLADGERIGVLRSSTVLLTNSLYTSRSVSFAPEGVVLAAEALDPGAAWTPVDGHHRLDIGPEGLSDAELVFF